VRVARKPLLVALVLLGLVLPASSAYARAGFVDFVYGPTQVSIKLTLHYKEIVYFSIRCPSTGGTYSMLSSSKHPKATRSGSFLAHPKMHYEVLNRTTEEFENLEVPVTLSAHFTGGHAWLRGTVTNSLCNGGKPFAFKAGFFGYDF